MGKKSRKKKGRRRLSRPEFLVPWMDDEGLHVFLPGEAPSGELLEQLTEQYQQNIRNSALWDEIVRRFGPEEAERILKEFRIEVQ